MMLAPSRAAFSIALLLTNVVGLASTMVLAAPSLQSDQTEACAACAETAGGGKDGGVRDSRTKNEEKFLDHVINCRTLEAPAEREPDPEGKLADVHVAYSSNARQFPGILLSMVSLVRHMEKPETAIIHLIVSREDWGEAMKMVSCFNRSASELRALPRVILHLLRPVGFNLSALNQSWRPELLEQPHTFVRFYLQMYLRKAPRVLWLDSDTIVKADVTPLYHMKMNNPLAAALESGQEEGKGRLFVAAKWLNASVNSLEWNTGVLVYDLARWRSENISDQCNKWAVKVNAVAGDQIAMNLALFGRIDTLDWRWNLRGWNVGRPPALCLDRAKILHWSGRPATTFKPWQIGAGSALRRRWGYELVEPYILNPPCPLKSCSNAAVT